MTSHPSQINRRSRDERGFRGNRVNRCFLDNRNVQKKASFYGRVLDQQLACGGRV
jgi:hypothetical protein